MTSALLRYDANGVLVSSQTTPFQGPAFSPLVAAVAVDKADSHLYAALNFVDPNHNGLTSILLLSCDMGFNVQKTQLISDGPSIADEANGFRIDGAGNLTVGITEHASGNSNPSYQVAQFSPGLNQLLSRVSTSTAVDAICIDCSNIRLPGIPRPRTSRLPNGARYWAIGFLKDPDYDKAEQDRLNDLLESISESKLKKLGQPERARAKDAALKVAYFVAHDLGPVKVQERLADPVPVRVHADPSALAGAVVAIVGYGRNGPLERSGTEREGSNHIQSIWGGFLHSAGVVRNQGDNIRGWPRQADGRDVSTDRGIPAVRSWLRMGSWGSIQGAWIPPSSSRRIARPWVRPASRCTNRPITVPWAGMSPSPCPRPTASAS